MLPLTLWDLIRLINSWNLLHAAKIAGGFGSPLTQDYVVDATMRLTLLKLASALSDECLALGLRGSWASAQRLQKLCRRDGAKASEFSEIMHDELMGRLTDELSTIHLFALDDASAMLHAGTDLFGTEVADRFPSAILDIEEAGKCLAFERGTACVFHCMRVMEVGLKSLAKALGIDYAPSWESYLTQIDKEFKRAWKDKEPAWKQDEAFYTEAAADLTVVKRAWRNPTMHVRIAYDPVKAKEVFDGVKAFMRHLSTKLREVP